MIVLRHPVGHLAEDARAVEIPLVVRADNEATVPTLRSFTRHSFRQNLARHTGKMPVGTEAHHVFPQRFARQFEQRGINIHDPRYGAWWDATAHRRAYYQYNRQWEEFFLGNPTGEEALDFGRRIMQGYGFEPRF